ncbi:MAG: bifunctional [glutamine synthetase] adenylyltransferase/[glutamine synthetase]-adenylyl-L-tyrosine phosphorylase, partial [Actinobacteria bacterium]|nr:bifunctional [glutamine synthetase] adenylyltransferase/[glutamine synthetase]-adenylyl-L-tyrosine phosphorylase [Actinomycetota bacterium]
MALERNTSLSELAGYGFINLDPALNNLEELVALIGDRARPALAFVAKAQNPDQSLELLLRLSRNHTSQLKSFCAKASHLERLCLILGASSALFEFLDRHIENLGLLEGKPSLPTLEDHSRELFAQAGSVAQIRIGYRKQLTKIASFDIEQLDPVAGVAKVAASLADLAGATLDAGLLLARQEISNPENTVSFPELEVSATRVAVIGMGKCGARELNYISDVDVIFVAEPSGDIASSRAMEIATKLVTRMMRVMDEVATEPPLWQVDANLRPEGKSGALVRSLDSHQNYYERWAESWEFQALLKARPIAGDQGLGADYIARIWPKVWESTVRENFVESVQKMRQRVTDNIPTSEVDAQIKLGPGGLRDIEFTVQLLQLVHGRSDQSIRVRDTLGALEALSNGSYIGRDDAERFSAHYRFLRLLEHRIQLSAMRRTHLMPTDEKARRAIARAVSLELTAEQLISRWEKVKLEVRDLHQQLFYRPLLSAVSGLSQEDLELTSAQAQDRLAAIGFGDTKGALAHISALTTGLSRRAAIQRQLLPVLLQWFAEGTDPDAALLAFRRLSEDLGDSHWYLRMLRDSSGAAKRMTQVFSTSRLATSLFEKMPEAAAWFDREDELEPDTLESLNAQFEAIVSRHEDAELAAASIRSIRRKETLRVAMGAALGIIDLERTSQGLTDLTESYLTAIQEIATKFLIERQGPLCHELAIVAMGRFGGGELGFGSDADVMFVYRVLGEDVNKAQAEAEILVSEIRRLSADQSLEFELDLDLRPEGKNGPIVRSIDSYAAYYKRWAGTWESQALLRARLISGEQAISSEFVELIDQYRYPEVIEQAAIVEIRRIKARVEVERLPQGADPKRHLKLGRGSISDVEWLVQLFQLKYASANPQIQTPHTLPALGQMEACGLINNSDARV